MKVFISHSAYDKWVARQMSRLLEGAGHTTFLDEKDIKTGDSIDTAIQRHLKDSEHLLILVSPASITSHWVFIELGGAKALGKRVVPILFHVGANEVPAAIAQLLARDINDFDRYVDELASNGAGKRAAASRKAPKPKKAADKPRPDESPPLAPSSRPATAMATDGTEIEIVTEGTIEGYSVGDKVRIVDVANLTEENKTEPPKWTAAMNRFSAMETHITGLWPDGRFVRLAADDGAFWWLRSWISKIDK